MSRQNGKKLTASFEAEPDNTSLVVLPGTPEQIMRDALALGYRKIVLGWSNQIQLEVFVEEDLDFILQAHLDIQRWNSVARQLLEQLKAAGLS